MSEIAHDAGHDAGHGHGQVDTFEPAMTDVYNGKLAMWLFLCSEVMFFSGLLGSYLALRIGNEEIFKADQKYLHDNVAMAAFNTALLITSSLTMALAVKAGQAGDRAKQSLLCYVTAAMGALFLCLKYVEYTNKWAHGIYPSKSIFFSFYFTMTGVHAFHILAGVIPIAGLGLLCKKRNLTAETEMLGLYWHFVDLVWIFLFPLMYLI